MRTRRQTALLILTLGLLDTLTPFSIDLYLPAFAEIARDLNTAVARVSLSVSIYFVGFALGQILYGPLLDRFGRKPPVYVGISIYLLSTIGLITATHIETFLVFRFLSALGGSATAVAALTMVRDYFAPKDSAKVLSMLMLVLSTSPLLAPSIGSAIVLYGHWRMLFVLLAALAIFVAIMLVLFIPPGYVADPSVKLTPLPLLRSFRDVFANRVFRVYVLTTSFSFCGLFVYVAGSPAIFLEGYRVSAQAYGAIFALLATAMIGGGQLNHWFLRHFSSQTVFRAALILQVASSSIFLGASLWTGASLAGTLVAFFVILGCAGVTSPNGAAMALEPFSKNVGTASALLGFLQLSVGSALAAVVGILDLRGTLPTAVAMAASAWIALTVLLVQGRSLPENPTEKVDNLDNIQLFH